MISEGGPVKAQVRGSALNHRRRHYHNIVLFAFDSRRSSAGSETRRTKAQEARDGVTEG